MDETSQQHDFIPNLIFSSKGRRYWGLPVTGTSEIATGIKSTVVVACELLEQNMKALDKELNIIARDVALRANVHDTSRVAIYCGLQAIETIKDVRALLLSIPSG